MTVLTELLAPKNATTLASASRTKYVLDDLSLFKSHRLHNQRLGMQIIHAMGKLFGDIGGNTTPTPDNMVKVDMRIFMLYGDTVIDIISQTQMIPKTLTLPTERELAIIDTLLWDAFAYQDTPFTEQELQDEKEDLKTDHPGCNPFTGTVTWGYSVVVL